MKFSRAGLHYLEALLRLVYPSYCSACQSFLAIHEKDLCQSCTLRLGQSRLPLHQILLNDTIDSVDQAWALYPYESPIREVITGIKFLKKKWLTRFFRSSIDEISPILTGASSYDWILPIPLHRLKRAQREFNQAEAVGQMVARATGVKMNTRILVKNRSTSAQSHLTRDARLKNLSGSFKITYFNNKKVLGKSILLVDDILTTGQTAAEAASTLKKAGAKRVDILTLARTFEHHENT